VWRPWAEGREKLVLGAGEPRMASLSVDGERLLEELFASPHRTHAEKCAIYREDTMYPRYPLEALAARGCPLD
jgi:hypothetical protein